MEVRNKRWLISMMKTSGSKRRNVGNLSYAEKRNVKQSIPFEDLPGKESIKQSFKFYNGKINYSLLLRFLKGQVGKPWQEVYEEIISRIPTKLLDYNEMIFWFVADKVDIVDNKFWNRRTQKFITTSENWKNCKECEVIPFYVDPESQLLCKLG